MITKGREGADHDCIGEHFKETVHTLANRMIDDCGGMDHGCRGETGFVGEDAPGDPLGNGDFHCPARNSARHCHGITDCIFHRTAESRAYGLGMGGDDDDPPTI